MEELSLFERIIELLRAQPVLSLFLILGIGYLIGGIRVAGFSLGPVAGVLFAGLFLGHFEFRMAPGAQAVGFALFIFSVGYQAGPRFFDVLKSAGLKYFLLALVIAVTGFGVAVIATKFLSLAPGMSAGILAGGLTSSPTLAAAQEALRSGQIAPPSGMAVESMINNVATGYAITYLFGLAGLIAIISLMPKLLGINLAAEARKLEEKEKSGFSMGQANIGSRVYKVTNPELTEKTIAELTDRYWDKTSVIRIGRDGAMHKPETLDYLKLGDEIHILAPVEYFAHTVSRVSIGEEIVPDADSAQHAETAQIVIINSATLGKTLEQLDIARKFGVLVTGVSRMRMEIPLNIGFKLRKGDILSVVGPHENLDMLGVELGHTERDVAETDMVTFAFGIAIGVIVGLFSISIGQLSIGLGSAGGLLASGLVIGYLRSVNPRFGRLPDAARWILMEFGLLVFMAGVGLSAGGDIINTLISAGPVLIIAGMMVTIVPIVVGYLFGSKVLKIHPVLLLGGITGSMTSGASLSVVTKAANSPLPSLGYTGAYAFANVLLTIAGGVILYF